MCSRLQSSHTLSQEWRWEVHLEYASMRGGPLWSGHVTRGACLLGRYRFLTLEGAMGMQRSLEHALTTSRMLTPGSMQQVVA